MNCCPATHGVKLTERTGHSLRLFDDLHRPRQHIDWHVHDRPCITYLYQGSYTESYLNRSIDCIAPSLLVKPGGESHKDHYYPSGARSLVLVLEQTEAPGLNESLQQVAYLDDAEADLAGKRLQREFRQWDNATPMIVDGIVREIVGWARRSRSRLSVHEDRENRERWIDRVRERLYRESDRSITVAELANDESVHPDHLTREFKKRFQMLPGEYLRSVRLARAHRAVTETERPLKDIAHECGFADQSHLTRLFKAEFGKPPARLRRKHRF